MDADTTSLTPVLTPIVDPGDKEEGKTVLTLKQAKFLDIYLQTGNATEAAMQAYDCKDRNSAKVIGSQNLTKLNYIDILEMAGVSDKILIDKLKDGLDASRIVSVPIEEEGKTVNKRLKVPDFATRHKYMETGLKLKRRLVEKLEIEETKTINLNVNTLLTKVYGQPELEQGSTA